VMMSELKIGCCGFPRSRKTYFKYFKLVEVQQTFYKPPSIETLKSWRSEAPSDFEFTVKAWQIFTHSPSSPTWRRAGLKISEEEAKKYGMLRPSRENLEAWEQFKEVLKALNARIVVFQTPPSFRCTEENINNAIEFFKSISSSDIVICWEPRGDWLRNPEKILRVVEEANVVHVVDILR